VRDLSVAANGGGYLVQTDQGAPRLPFIDLVRARSVVGNLGATFLDGLKGAVAIPKGSTSSTAQWLTSEVDSITPSTPTLGSLTLSPRTVGALVKFSVLLSKQSSPAVESMLFADLAAALAEAVDVAAIQGSGSGGTPQGIIGTTGVGSVTGTSLGWTGCVDAQFDVMGGYGIAPAGCAYATTAAVAQTLMGRQRFTNTDSPVWQGAFADGQIAGCRAIATSSVPASTLIFGHWPDLLVGDWGGLELMVDPYSDFKTQTVAARALWSVDLVLRRPGSFTVAASVT
jgi:HK97 family phage major capsid protein